MQMYNFLEYNLNYSDTTASLCFYSKDNQNTFNADIAYNNSNHSTMRQIIKKHGS